MPVGQAVHIDRAVPKAAFAVVPGAGHSINVELFTALTPGCLLRHSLPELFDKAK